MSGLNGNPNDELGFSNSNVSCQGGSSLGQNATPFLEANGRGEGACLHGTDMYGAGNTPNQGSMVGNEDGTAPSNMIQYGAAAGVGIGGHIHCFNSMRGIYGQTGGQYTCTNSVQARDALVDISAGVGHGASASVPLMAAAQIAGSIRNL
jgi:hypothetical protein